jgi:4-hydroxybenzoate polyprenyltransferase
MSRIDHWPKNILIVPGYFFAMNLSNLNLIGFLYFKNLFLIIVSACFASSANYILNEFVDARTDAYHPSKKNRAAVIHSYSPIKIAAVYFAWAISSIVLISFSKIGIVLIVVYLILGLLYNIKPIRLKDLPYIDIISESANNPIRLVLGWASAASDTTPLTLIIGFWCIGGFLMGAKRHSELIQLSLVLEKSEIIKYRKSFSVYTIHNLFFFSNILAYLSIISFSIFSIKYNPMFIFFTVIVAFWIVDYGSQVNIPDSMLQNPEKLIKSRKNFFYAAMVIISFFMAQFINIDLVNSILSTTNLNFIDFWGTLLNS